MKTTSKGNDNYTVETVIVNYFPNENLLAIPVGKLVNPANDDTTNFLLSLRKPTRIKARIYTPIMR